MPSQLLEQPAISEEQTVAVVKPETSQSELDVNAEAFDFITRRVLETDAMIFEG